MATSKRLDAANLPLSVKVTPEEKEELSKIAAGLGVSRHELLRYAVRKLLADWKKGERPAIASRGIRLEPK